MSFIVKGTAKMTKPCTSCNHCEIKNGIAGRYYCKSKNAITSVARITNDGRTIPKGDVIDCHEMKVEK